MSALALSVFFYGIRSIAPPPGSQNAALKGTMFTKVSFITQYGKGLRLAPLGLLPVGALVLGPLLLSKERGVKLLRYITIDNGKAKEEEKNKKSR